MPTDIRRDNLTGDGHWVRLGEARAGPVTYVNRLVLRAATFKARTHRRASDVASGSVDYRIGDFTHRGDTAGSRADSPTPVVMQKHGRQRTTGEYPICVA